MTRDLYNSVGLKDCEVVTFADSPGVRVIHRPSGAEGESYGERTQMKNKKQALRRMTESPEFASWSSSNAAR